MKRGWGGGGLGNPERGVAFATALMDEPTYIVFDTETTGTAPARDRIIEIAALKVRGGAVVERFVSLVNPECLVPRFITDLTGLSTAHLIGAPTAAEVMPAFEAFCGEALLVGHNVAFDVGMVNAERARLGLAPIPNPTVCTLRLARRALPGKDSKALQVLAARFSIPRSAAHRAEADAETTLALLGHLRTLLGEADASLGALRHRQHGRYDNAPKHVETLRARVAEMPDRPGVYFWLDGRGQVVYVGKAKRLRQRVRSYVTAIENKPGRLRDLVETVRDVRWTETGSELKALLEESRLIKELQPRFNRASRRYKSRPFIRLDTSEAPRASVASYLLDDGAEYFGPLSGRRQAEIVVEVINRFFRLRECDEPTFRAAQAAGPCLYAEMGRCLAPCVEANRPAYAEEVARVRAFLLGQDTDLAERLVEAMREAAGRREYELAGTYRDWAQALERLAGKQSGVAASVLDHHAVIVQDGVSPGTQEVFVVRYGRLVGQTTVAARPSEADRAALATLLAEHFSDAVARPTRYLKPEVDEIRLLAHWLYVYRDSARHVRPVPGAGPEEVLNAVLAALHVAEDEGAFEEV